MSVPPNTGTALPPATVLPYAYPLDEFYALARRELRVLQDAVKREYGVQSQPYPRPAELSGSLNLGLFDYPAYQESRVSSAVRG